MTAIMFVFLIKGHFIVTIKYIIGPSSYRAASRQYAALLHQVASIRFYFVLSQE